MVVIFVAIGVVLSNIITVDEDAVAFEKPRTTSPVCRLPFQALLCTIWGANTRPRYARSPTSDTITITIWLTVICGAEP
jgi:hypothetical protein